MQAQRAIKISPTTHSNAHRRAANITIRSDWTLTAAGGAAASASASAEA